VAGKVTTAACTGFMTVTCELTAKNYDLDPTPKVISKRCQPRMPLAQCAGDLDLYTIIDCDKITHKPPVAVSHQQQAAVFDV